MKYEINVQQVDESGEYADGFELRLRVGPEAIARIMPGLLAESVGAERVAVTTVMPSDVPAAAQAEPTKRPRRTKAQIEADKLAQQNGGEPTAQPVSEPQPAGTVPPQPEPAAATPAVPYDPFAPK